MSPYTHIIILIKLKWYAFTIIIIYSFHHNHAVLVLTLPFYSANENDVINGKYINENPLNMSTDE